MKKYFFLFAFILTVYSADATSVLASTFGFNELNATTALSNAILSANDTIIVDKQNANWKTGPLIFLGLNNKTIIFQKDVVVEAIAGAFNATNACLFKFQNSNNIILLGYGASFKMNKAEFILLNNSEHRMNISLINCKYFTIKGLYLDESGGDGIYIGGDGTNYCKSILIEDVVCNNHYRQGMSITNVEDMKVRYCKFINTQGTLPEAGVDIEPYQVNQRIVNLYFENCSFQNNGWAGLAVAVSFLDSSSLPVSINVVDCYFKNNCLPANAYAHCEIFLGADNFAPVSGNVLFERCFIDGSQYGALYTRKTADAYKVKFKDCTFQNVSQQQIQYNEPIFLEVPSYSSPCGYLGGLEFDNVFLSYNTNFNFFRVFGWTTLAGIKDITGKFTIVEPNNHTPLYNNVADTVNVTYTYSDQTLLPATSVSISVLQQNAIECNQTPAIQSFTRNSANISYPLGISYVNSGTCIMGDDVHYLAGGIVFPTSSNKVQDSVWVRDDRVTEPTDTLITSLASRSDYTLESNNNSIIKIADCNTVIVVDSNISTKPFIMYPNPTKGLVFVKSNFTAEKIELYNVMGQLCLQETNIKSLDVSHLANGLYFVKFFYNKNVFTSLLTVAR
ncbi:MAG: T9SS type A sorting domain-containing protein [Ferruginibacter sp.]|nr:T9SS type A sorting domain-containing protein [Ferruginibacter sp.]